VDDNAAQKIRLIMELRRMGITNTDVLSAMERIPREVFVPTTFRDRAYENIALPINNGQTISQPYIVAYMTQLLNPDARAKVLEIGTGSGYQAAILSKLFRRTYSIERFRSLHIRAGEVFEKLKLSNITTKLGDGHKGWSEQAPFSHIIVTAAAADVPAPLVDQLGDNGVLVIPVGPDQGDQTILRISKDHHGMVAEEEMIPVRFVPLVQGLAVET
jgi:protein-L-isoaspartate(D-aspartate) O-methyltransferase